MDDAESEWPPSSRLPDLKKERVSSNCLLNWALSWSRCFFRVFCFAKEDGGSSFNIRSKGAASKAGQTIGTVGPGVPETKGIY